MTPEELDALVDDLLTMNGGGGIHRSCDRLAQQAAQAIKELREAVEAGINNNLELVHRATAANVKASNAMDRAEAKR